jgi:hypothetical protein
MLAGGPSKFVKEKLAGVDTPPTWTVTVYCPAMLLAVNVGAVATPCAFVAAVATFPPAANVPPAPFPDATNVTVTPLNKLPLASFTVACSAVVNDVLMVALCPEPALAIMLAATPARFVSEKPVVRPPTTLAVIVYCPAVLLAVNVGAVATPCAFVVAVLPPPANVPLAPLPGAVKVTVTPLNKLPPASFTVACSAVANDVLIGALCTVPAVAAMLAGEPSKFVKEKLAGFITLGTLAVTA